MPNLHRHPHVVRFGECDPAGVVYFPTFFDWFHQAMESWFDDALGLPYAEILQSYGFPAVHTEADFRRPCRMGEAITVTLSVGDLGRTRIRLIYAVLGPDGEERARGATDCAVIARVQGEDGFRFKAVEIPPDLRARIEHFQSEDSPFPS